MRLPSVDAKLEWCHRQARRLSQEGLLEIGRDLVHRRDRVLAPRARVPQLQQEVPMIGKMRIDIDFEALDQISVSCA